MKLAKLNFYRQLFFVLIIVLGAAYLLMLLVFSQKVFSGFAMQFIFLFDALWVHPQNVFALVVRRDFLIPIIAGSVWIYLLVLFFHSLVSTIRKIIATSYFISGLKAVKSTSAYQVIKDPNLSVFTAGLIAPKIYLSQKLITACTADELASVLYHEQSHVRNFDPLRSLIVSFISGFLPSFTGKDYMFGQYHALVEIGCDTYSHRHHSHPTSLVSALLKIGEQPRPTLESLSLFSAHSERIKVLVGRKKQPLLSLVVANLTMITFLVVSTSFLVHTDLFYQCQHLAQCFLNLFSEDHMIRTVVSDSHSCNLN